MSRRVRNWVRRYVLAVDVLPLGAHREPWSTWRPAGETFTYLRAFTTGQRLFMVGVLPRREDDDDE